MVGTVAGTVRVSWELAAVAARVLGGEAVAAMGYRPVARMRREA